jgi:tetratricopeptide (TPR) repeat protein
MTGSSSPRRPARASHAGSRRLRALIILTGFAAAVVGAAVLGWRYAEASKPLAGPIVLISIDTLRADRLPAYGYRAGITPNLDRLAQEGIVFERAYAHAPQTLPSHASLLTGRLPFEHGVRDNAGFALDESQPTLAELLGGRGFDTAAAVSSYLLREETGMGRGFEVYDAKLPAASRASTVPVVERSGRDTVSAAESWLDEQRSSRFFYFLHLFEPHKPYAPPAGLRTGHPYDGEVAFADELVGRFLAALQRRGFYDQALIIVTSDHGEGLGDHGAPEHGLFLYDEAVRVPLIIKMPGTLEARRVSAPVQHIDLVPTILDLVRAPAAGGMRGRSLRRLLEDRDETSLRATRVYAEAMYGYYQFGWAPIYSVTDGRTRFIQAPRAELYDLETDPDEQSNLAADRKSEADGMAATITELIPEAMPPRPDEISPDEDERLSALGHVGIDRAWSPLGETGGAADPKDMVLVLVAFRRGMELASARRFAEAIDALKALASGRPGMGSVWHEVGKLELATGRTQEALTAFRRFAAHEPDNPRGALAVGVAQLTLDRFEEAGRQAALALALSSATADVAVRPAAYDLGIRAAFGRRETAAARALAEEAEKVDPSMGFGPYVEARLALDRDDPEAALPLFEKAAAATRDHPNRITGLYWHLGDALARLERYDAAERAFKREIELAPRNTRAYASLAKLYRASHRDEQAAETLDALVRAIPTPEGYALAARLWTVLGDRDRADAMRKLGQATRGH